MTVVGDILVVTMMNKIKFNKKREYSKRHHSGYLGQKAKRMKNFNINCWYHFAIEDNLTGFEIAEKVIQICMIFL